MPCFRRNAWELGRLLVFGRAMVTSVDYALWFVVWDIGCWTVFLMVNVGVYESCVDGEYGDWKLVEFLL